MKNTLLISIFSLLIILLCFFNEEGGKASKDENLIDSGSPKNHFASPRNQSNKEQGEIPKKEEDDSQVFPIEINSDTERIPQNVEILKKIDPILLEKIKMSMEIVRSRSRDKNDPSVDSWMSGREKISFSFQKSPNQRPVLGYLGIEYFFYADFNHPDFSKGYAISKKTGDIYVWDLSR